VPHLCAGNIVVDWVLSMSPWSYCVSLTWFPDGHALAMNVAAPLLSAQMFIPGLLGAKLVRVFEGAAKGR